MPYDFGIIDSKVLIELDGDQHFRQVSNWNSPENTQLKDIEKINYAYENNYSLIHIYQKEVWDNSYDWKTLLIKVIDWLKNNSPIILFISCSNKYIDHITKLDSKIKYKVINPQNFKL